MADAKAEMQAWEVRDGEFHVRKPPAALSHGLPAVGGLQELVTSQELPRARLVIPLSELQRSMSCDSGREARGIRPPPALSDSGGEPRDVRTRAFGLGCIAHWGPRFRVRVRVR